MKINWKILEEKIAYTFQNPALLTAALTHRSVKGHNNERLEFLGDSLVNFFIAEVLYQTLPEAREGKLSRLRANLINGETLADIAFEFALGDYMLLGQGEIKSGGHQRSSILADALEALIAAIYLDGGLEKCRECVLRWYASRLEKHQLTTVHKDAKTQLQEYLQAHKFALPHYEIEKIEGDAHNQVFYVKCEVENFPHSVKGVGSSRRKAEQEAANAYMALLRKQHG